MPRKPWLQGDEIGMRTLAYLFISAWLIQNAQQLPWHEAEGSVTIGEDEKLSAARDRAQSDALRKAVEEANGVEVTGDTIVKNSQLASDIARTFARGDVRRWEVLESKPLPRQSEGKWYVDWIVRLRAQVVPPKNVKHDPVFVAHISLDGKNKF